MSRFVKAGLVCAAALAATWGVGACRAIVGIEELDLEADGGGDSSADGRASDAASDASPDAGFTPDIAQQAKIAGCQVTAQCRQCCKEQFSDVAKRLEDDPRTKECFCASGPGSCQSQCADYCSGGGPDQTCIPCIDDGLKAGRCTDACTSSSCKAGLACIQACP